MYVFQFASLTLLSAYLVHYKFPCKIVPDVTFFVLLHKKLSVGKWKIKMRDERRTIKGECDVWGTIFRWLPIDTASLKKKHNTADCVD